MTRIITKTTQNVMFGPVRNWGELSVVIKDGRQYTLTGCPAWTNHIRFDDLQAATQRAIDVPPVEVARFELESRECQGGLLDLEEANSWAIVVGSMIIQEQEWNGAEVIEEADNDGLYKTIRVNNTLTGRREETLLRTPRKTRTHPTYSASVSGRDCDKGKSESRDYAATPVSSANREGNLNTTSASEYGGGEDEIMGDDTSTVGDNNSTGFLDEGTLIQVITDAARTLEYLNPKARSKKKAITELIRAAGKIIEKGWGQAGITLSDLNNDAADKDDRKRLTAAIDSFRSAEGEQDTRTSQKILIKLAKLDCDLTEVRVHFGMGTIEDVEQVKKDARSRQEESKKKQVIKTAEKSMKKVEARIAGMEKRQKEAVAAVEDATVRADSASADLQILNQQMSVRQDIHTAEAIREKAREMHEAQELQAWHPIGGIKGRNIAIVTHHDIPVPRDMTRGDVQSRVSKINT